MHQIVIHVNMENAVAINVGTTSFYDKEIPDMSEPGEYELFYVHNGVHWICGCTNNGVSD